MNGLKDKIDTLIVLITHDMGVVANMADRIYVMYAGKIVEHGDADAVFHNPRHPYIVGASRQRAAPRPEDGSRASLHPRHAA